MKRETTLMTAAAFFVVLGFTAAQAGPQSEPVPSGGPAGNIAAGCVSACNFDPLRGVIGVQA